MTTKKVDLKKLFEDYKTIAIVRALLVDPLRRDHYGSKVKR